MAVWYLLVSLSDHAITVVLLLCVFVVSSISVVYFIHLNTHTVITTVHKMRKRERDGEGEKRPNKRGIEWCDGNYGWMSRSSVAYIRNTRKHIESHTCVCPNTHALTCAATVCVSSVCLLEIKSDSNEFRFWPASIKYSG